MIILGTVVWLGFGIWAAGYFQAYHNSLGKPEPFLAKCVLTILIVEGPLAWITTVIVGWNDGFTSLHQGWKIPFWG